MNDADISAFAGTLRGGLIRTSDPGYDEARKLYNAMIDKRPLLIAQCVDVADVIAAVNFARENQLPVAIRGGGHNGAGLGSVDDGILIDLSQMKGVRVDPKNRTVRVGLAARPAKSTTRPTHSARRCRSASSRRPGSPA